MLNVRPRVAWGTWEELVLGGAVLRHGTAAWDAVAGELRARTPHPELFTPKDCEAKYEDLRERYSGSDTWFEELRKQRVDDLRKCLEKSEDYIGSLQSKLKSLNAGRGSNSRFDCDTSREESPLPTENTEGLDSSNKEASRDRLSARSYMENTGRDWSWEKQISASVSSQENYRKEDLHENGRKDTGVMQGIFRKKRSLRKRRDYTIVKERIVGESISVDLDSKELPIGCDQDVRTPQDNARAHNEDSDGRVQCNNSRSFLMRIMNLIMEQECASIFRRRLKNKGARYKKMSCRHVDLQVVNSRISNGSISSAKEFFRDLLVLAANAIAFYPKNSPEYKLAVTLHHLVSQALQEYSWTPTSSKYGVAVPIQMEREAEFLPMKPRNLQACSHKKPVISGFRGNVAGYPLPEEGKKKACHNEESAESLARKRVVGKRDAEGSRVSNKRGMESLNEGRKRARIR